MEQPKYTCSMKISLDSLLNINKATYNELVMRMAVIPIFRRVGMRRGHSNQMGRRSIVTFVPTPRAAPAKKALPILTHVPGMLKSQYFGMGLQRYRKAKAPAREYPIVTNKAICNESKDIIG